MRTYIVITHTLVRETQEVIADNSCEAIHVACDNVRENFKDIIDDISIVYASGTEIQPLD